MNLVEVTEPGGDPPEVAESVPTAAASGEHAGDETGADPFLAEATREFEAGRIDKALWAHAIVQTGADEALATTTYLRARATALRMAKRAERKERSRATHREKDADDEAQAPVADDDVQAPEEPAAPRHALLVRRKIVWAAGALASLVVLAAVIALRWSDDPVQQSSAIAATPPVTASRLSTPASGAQDANPKASTVTPNRPEEDFPARIRELKDAGNWHVLVIYAVEWTRKHPTDPEAWKELGAGYAKLHQYHDAFDAATRSSELAPGDFATWRTLGEVNLALNDPAAALAAFEKAASLNDKDVPSLVQTGTLSMQLGNLSGAKVAFAKALAVSPGDADALCGAASTARLEGHPKEADAITSQLTASGASCRNSTAGEGAVVKASVPARNRSPSGPGR